MQSKVNITYKIDDIQEATKELLAGLEDVTREKGHAAGILYVYSDCEVEELVAAVSAKANFPIVGCTSIASIENTGGMHEMCAMLTVLSADDCDFTIVRTEPVTRGNIVQEVETAYATATQNLPSPIKLVFALAPYNLDIMLDEYTNTFNQVAPGIPFVGGLPSYHANGDINATFYDGTVTFNQIVLLAISGNLQPVFSVQTVTGGNAKRKCKVTSAKENVVYTVDDEPFTDFLVKMGLPVENLEANTPTTFFVSNPLLLENIPSEKGSDFSFMRTLHKIDLEEGSGTAIGHVPQGATLSICSLDREGIERGGKAAVEELQRKMLPNEKNGYTYSTVLAISCIGRFTIMIPKSSVETESIRAQLPANLTLSGFYGHGEIGPLPGTSGEAENFAHNESLVLCAF